MNKKDLRIMVLCALISSAGMSLLVNVAFYYKDADAAERGRKPVIIGNPLPDKVDFTPIAGGCVDGKCVAKAQGTPCTTANSPQKDGKILSDCAKQTHTECKDNSCTWVDGPGANLCATRSPGSILKDQCQDATHAECVGKQCQQVAGGGWDLCDTTVALGACTNWPQKPSLGGGSRK